MKFGHTAHTRDLLHIHTACVLLDENQHFQDEGAETVPKPKAQSQGSRQQDLDLFENGGAGVWRSMKLGFWKKIAVEHDFFTHLKRDRDFTGSHDSISSNMSSVK